MQGLDLTTDLRGCRCEPRWLLDAAWRAGLSPVGQLAHGFDASPHGPGGVTLSKRDPR